MWCLCSLFWIWVCLVWYLLCNAWVQCGCSLRCSESYGCALCNECYGCYGCYDCGNCVWKHRCGLLDCLRDWNMKHWLRVGVAGVFDWFWQSWFVDLLWCLKWLKLLRCLERLLLYLNVLWKFRGRLFDCWCIDCVWVIVAGPRGVIVTAIPPWSLGITASRRVTVFVVIVLGRCFGNKVLGTGGWCR